jgi:hypothetical protein
MINQSDLQQFYGTEQHYRYLNILITDGVKYLADQGQCHWLLGIMASFQNQLKRNGRLYEFCLWQVEREKDGAIITARGDTNEPAFLEQHLDYAEFPFNIKLYQCGKVVMLPSEY